MSISSSPPQLNLNGDNSFGRKIGEFFGWDKSADVENQSSIAQYNNEYNYWLWKQQAEYNSPSAQVERLKAAGLNPNYNSIDGTGNLTSAPASQARYNGLPDNPITGALSSMMNPINLVTSAIGSVGKLAETIKAFKENMRLGTPAQIREMRKLTLDSLRATVGGKRASTMKSMIDSVFSAMDFGVTNLDDFLINGDSITNLGGELAPLLFDTAVSPRWTIRQGAADYVGIKNRSVMEDALLKALRRTELTPAQIAKIRADIRVANKRAELLNKDIQWYSATHVADMLSKIGRTASSLLWPKALGKIKLPKKR